jgi:putative ABC transport system ATP-binding protein/lipoprotein-releasing system ATP-binding protein
MGIVAKAITKTFGTPPTTVLQGVTFEIKSGEFVSLTGRSGSGKSTLLYILSSLDWATAGEVRYDDREIRSLSGPELHHLRNREMGFVFQFHYLLPELSALENVLMPARKQGRHVELLKQAQSVLGDIGLGDKMNRLPRQLSGGEQQRVAIARAMVLRPKYLFADEPTGNLDSKTSDIVLKTFQELNQKQGRTIILITHEHDVAKYASRTIYIRDGLVENQDYKI